MAQVVRFGERGPAHDGTRRVQREEDKMPAKKSSTPDYGKTLGVTQELRRDIVEFLSSKHTSGATLTVKEIMALYKCPEDRAQRVIASLVKDNFLVPAGPGAYKVTI